MFTKAKLFHEAGEGSGGGGGGDQHNLGWYATSSDLQTAHPTASAGDWAIVGATDTVWVWDTDTSAWVDTDTKGQVTSVNGATGAVTIGANDVLPTQTGYSGRVLGTDGFVAGWVKPEIVQRTALPVASQDEEGNIYQFVGTTDANYTNGYFYECVSDGATPPVYSWTRVDVQPAGSSLPTQTGNAGKFLTTDGTDASWSDKPLVNTATGTNSLTIAGTAATTNYGVNIGFGSGTTSNASVAIGSSSTAHISSVAIGAAAKSTGTSCVAIGQGAESSNLVSVAIGASAKATTAGSIQIGEGTNSTPNSLSIGYNYRNYQLLDSDGTVPADRLVHAINKYSTMPTAASTNEGWIVQYTGATDANYTHGYIYECVSDGGNPATYSWTAVSVQAGGGSSLPSQTGNAGKFLTTDGTDASWGTTTGEDISLEKTRVYSSPKLWFKYGTGDFITSRAAIRLAGDGMITFGSGSLGEGDQTVKAHQFFPRGAGQAGNNADLGAGTNQYSSWDHIYVKKVNAGSGAGDITVPTVAGTMVVATPPSADGTYILKATVSSGVVTIAWVAE